MVPASPAPCLLLSAARTRGDLCYCDLGINLGRILGVPVRTARGGRAVWSTVLSLLPISCMRMNPFLRARCERTAYQDDDQHRAYDAGQYDQHIEERLVKALDFHVQDSVNKALVKALRPFA
ncbi:hypothetical protein NDU88_004835 [Pleurodeles waltl]|uniref:Uncharacterized protein n=1 Tax=Pleurodeles waltl TaxID=8319 RepID=A0AAV7V437_PLEWA|nr:hypothetical protein NDU88_004835 [Pleurodeles waltl]